MSYNKNSQPQFEITERIGVISESPTGWTKELNKVSWNDTEPKWDIREWSPERDKMSKGVTLSDEEMAKLMNIIGELDKDREDLYAFNIGN